MTVVAYDSAGNRTENCLYHQGQLATRLRSSYESGWLRRVTLEEDGRITESVVNGTFDAFIRLCQSRGIDVKTGLPEAQPAETDDARDELKHDKEGREIESVGYDKDGKLDHIIRYTYETDEWGNWIKKRAALYFPDYADLGFQPSRITYREITYHFGK